MGAACGCGAPSACSCGDGAAFVAAVSWGPVGWRGLSVLSPQEQNGRYGDVVLTRLYSIPPGVQRRSLGFVPSLWDVPMRSSVPYWQQTVTPGNLPGGQRIGSQARAGALTPWTAAQMQGQLVKAQIAQSGLASTEFLRALIEANTRAA